MTDFNRRVFLGTAGLGLGAAAVAAPAIAQSQPKITWRLASAYPPSLDTLYGAANTFARMMQEMSDGQFAIQVTGPGELVSPGAGLEAVGNGTVEVAGTGSNIFTGVDPTFALAASVPFGVNTRMQNGFWYDGPGMEAWNEFYAKYNIYAIPISSTGAQMGGWFRDEVNGVDDLQGLKMRVGGLGGQIMARLGVVPQNIPGGDVYSSLERGTLDAAEWVGPYDDQKLGFEEVAKNYYFPGFWEGASMGHLFINLDVWKALPAAYKGQIRAAAAFTHAEVTAKYINRTPTALRELVAKGAQLKAFDASILKAAYDATQAVFDEISETNENFAKLYGMLKASADDGYLWWRFAEFTYDGTVIRNRS